MLVKGIYDRQAKLLEKCSWEIFLSRFVKLDMRIKKVASIEQTNFGETIGLISNIVLWKLINAPRINIELAIPFYIINLES